jgi:hypothetical protein
MVEQTNLESVSNDLEKENPLTAEALASTLLTKENLELKTEIPFSDAVWNTALLKSMGDMIELDFLELRDIIEVESPLSSKGNNNEYKIFVKVPVVENGIKVDVKITLAKYLGDMYKKQIIYAEEYAVSYHREGRKEVADMYQRKREEQERKNGKGNDILGDVAHH